MTNFLLLTPIILFFSQASSRSPLSFSSLTSFFLPPSDLDYFSLPPSLSLSPPFSPRSLRLERRLSWAVTDYVCPPSCPNRGCPFHSSSRSTKGVGGRRGALTLVFGHKQLSLIIVFLFSFPVPMEVWRDVHAIIRSSRPESAGPSESGLWSWDSAAFISMWVRSWFKRGVMGELTPGTQLSMGSAKRLYVLMAAFYTRWAF